MLTKIIILILLLPSLVVANHELWVKTTYPQDIEKKWWDENWWQEGKLSAVKNYQVEIKEANYKSGNNEISALVLRPKKAGKYPAVIFQHGRRGLDELVIGIAKRLAARGFVVLAPDLYSSHFIEALPLTHDYKIEKDAAKAIEVLLDRDDISSEKACVISHTRGGYYTLKALTTHKMQKYVACYGSTYPHWQDPNAPEPLQVYQYASEVDELRVPVLVMLGEHEQYQRVRSVTTAINSLKQQGKDATLIVYPGVGRGFDFRGPQIRTFADDLASKDAVQRFANFINKHLKR